MRLVALAVGLAVTLGAAVTVGQPAGSASPPGAQPPSAGAQPPSAGAQPPSAGAQPPSASAQPPSAGTQPPAAGAQPPAAQPPAAGAQPPAAGGDAPPPSGDAPPDADGPPRDGPEGAAPAEGDPHAGLPPGHPPMGAGASPALGGQMTREGFFRPAPDQVLIDKSLPRGAVAVQIVDADGQPVPNAPIALHILHSSVTKGESRERREVEADGEGRYDFRDLQVGSGVSYQVKSSRAGASYATQPFTLRDDGGVRAFLHVYEAAEAIEQTAVVFEGVVLLDIKEDNIAINHLLAVHNFGKIALTTDGLAMPLPPDAGAFQQQESMGEQAIVERDGTLALVGTFPPGTTQVTYRYQVPLRGTSSEVLALPMPPRLIASRVVVGAAESMTMTVAGLPPAQKGRWHDGKRVLETSGRPAGDMDPRSTSATTLHITISGIPTPGWGRWAAAALALVVAGGGGIHFVRSRRRRDLAPDQIEDLRDARARLLDEMALLERARVSGDVGPRTYDRLRLVLTDALARVVAQLGEDLDEITPDGPGDASAAAPKPRKKRRKKRVASVEA